MSMLDGVRKQVQAWDTTKAPKPAQAQPDLLARQRVSGYGGTQAADVQDGYAGYAAVYRSYTWVRRAIDVTANNIVSLPVRVVDANDKPLEQHPVSLLLARGNDQMTPATIWQHWLTNMYLGGEGPLEIVDDLRGNPLWLWPRRPDLVLIRADATPERANYPTVAGYVVMPEQSPGATTTPIDVPPANMIFDKFHNPLSTWRGLAPITALRASIIIDVFAQAWAKAFLQRGARPDYALVAPQGITQTEKERILSELMFSYSGADNWHKPIVLEEGITDIKTFSFPPADMEWIEQRQFTQNEVGALFGVPDEIMGYGKDTYENFQTALQVFWTLTLRPLCDHRDQALTHHFATKRPLLAPGERIATDYSGVGVLQEDKGPKVDMAVKLWQIGVPFNTLDEQLGLGIGPIEGGEFPNGTDPAVAQQMAELAAQGAQQAQDGNQGGTQNGQEAQQGGKTASPFLVIPGSLTPDRIKSLVLQLDPDEPDAEQLIRMALERRSAREIGRAISDMLETLYPDGWGGDWTRAEMEAIRVHNAFLADQRLRDALSRALLDGVDLGISVGVQQLENVGFGFDWTLAHIPARDWAIAYTDQVLEQIAQVTARGVGQAIGRWLENGEPLQALIDDLQPYFGPDRAARIAATEVTRAVAEGSEAAYKESGVVQEMEWQASMDERMCPVCEGLTGKRRKFGEPFSAGIDKPPAHVNCRCWVRPVIKEPRNG